MSTPASRPLVAGTARRRRCPLIIAAALVAAIPALAATVHTVAQRGRAFAVAAITIARGDSIRFTNEDEFLHQIFVDSTEMAFDSDEQLPGQTIEVRFPQAGTFAVRCHIHPKMLLTVTVR